MSPSTISTATPYLSIAHSSSEMDTSSDLRVISQSSWSRSHSGSRSFDRPLSPGNIHERPIFNGFQPTATPEPCNDCISECDEPGCADAQITPECTDQCVVVSCTEASHSNDTAHTCDDTSCHVIDECVGCGLQEFCPDFHPYFPDSRTTSSEGVSSQTWNECLEAFLCGCGEMNDSIHDEQRRQMQAMHGDLRSDETDITQYFMSAHGGSVAAQPHLQPTQPPTPQQHSTPAMDMHSAEFSRQAHDTISSRPDLSPFIRCLWGNCYAGFRTLPELVAHVNHQHLQIPEAAPLDALSCLWRNCTHPNSLPGPSSGNQLDHARGALTCHLLQDHLGLSVPLPPFPSLALPSRDEQVQKIAPRSPVSTAASVHLCRWKGCTLEFALSEELTAHITAVHVGGGKPCYECFWEGCKRNGERGFASKQKICRHLQSHTGHRPFQCKVCQLHFSEAATLQQHMRRHTQERPYKCDFPGCSKTFAITGALTIHKRTHNGVKPFKCSFCEKAFSESSNLAKHLRTHTGARPYACQQEGCGKTFARADQLTRHMGVHKKAAARASNVPSL